MYSKNLDFKLKGLDSPGPAQYSAKNEASWGATIDDRKINPALNIKHSISIPKSKRVLLGD